jgi:hypothetical protein
VITSPARESFSEACGRFDVYGELVYVCVFALCMIDIREEKRGKKRGRRVTHHQRESQ